MAAFFFSLICFLPPKLKDSSVDNRKRRTLLIFTPSFLLKSSLEVILNLV